jgi:hypothetical protein
MRRWVRLPFVGAVAAASLLTTVVGQGPAEGRWGLPDPPEFTVPTFPASTSPPPTMPPPTTTTSSPPPTMPPPTTTTTSPPPTMPPTTSPPTTAPPNDVADQIIQDAIDRLEEFGDQFADVIEALRDVQAEL